MRSSANGFQAITSGAMTGTAVVTGKALDMRGRHTASFHAFWTGTPNGAFTFYVSNVPGAVKDGVVDTTKFTALTNPAAFAALQPAGAAGSAFFAFADLACLWILPVYTNTSSTGTTNVYGEGV